MQKELTVLAQRRAPNGTQTKETTRFHPRVFVVIHSANPDPLWEQVFQWLYEQEKIDPLYQLKPGESIEVQTSGATRAMGFSLVCDGTALEDGPLSPRDHMEQCRLIQMKVKDAARRPPVGARLLAATAGRVGPDCSRCTPLKLHRILGDAPNLTEFFAEVRKVAE